MDNIEWVSSQLRAKTQSFEINSQGFSETDFRDKCGALATLPEPQQDLTMMIIGMETLHTRLRLENRLSRMIEADCECKGLKPRNGTTLRELSRKIARFGLHVFEHDLEGCLTAKGKLKVAGIELSEKSYQERWEVYEKLVINTLHDMRAKADCAIGEYRRNMVYS